MRRTSGLAITLAAIWVLSGCAILEPDAKVDAPTNVKAFEMNEGYALLYDLVSKEKQSSLLSIIKKVSPELKSLLERISETSKATAKELETLAKINPPLNLRSRICREWNKLRAFHRQGYSKRFYTASVELEFNMVSSQLAASNYAAHLARSLAVIEANPRRKEFLQRTAHKYQELHSQVYKMLFTRYKR
jgi:hypothetical protein